MSIDELRSQISAKEDEITKIEEESNKKEASAEKEIEAEYDSKIKDTESNLAGEQKELEEATAKAAEWNAKQKEKSVAVKTLNKELATNTKLKSKALATKLKEINVDKKGKIKAIQGEIKGLNKQIKLLEKPAA